MVPIYFGEDFSPGTPAKKILTSTLISGHVVAFNSANTFLEISVRGISGLSDFQIPHQGCGHYLEVDAFLKWISIHLKESH